MSANVCLEATNSGSTNAVGQDFTVSLSSSDMTAGEIQSRKFAVTFPPLISVKGMDFVDPTPFDVIFSSGMTIPATSCIDVSTTDDEAWEGPENFLVSITAVSNSQVDIDTTFSLVEIRDNEGREKFEAHMFSNSNNIQQCIQ